MISQIEYDALKERVRQLEARKMPDPDQLREAFVAYEAASLKGGDQLTKAREALLALLRPFMIGQIRTVRREEQRRV